MSSTTSDDSVVTPPRVAGETVAPQGGLSFTLPTEDELLEIPNAISAWNSVLMYLDDSLLPGFARLHIARLGQSVAPGLRVEVQTAWGPRVPSTLIIRLQVRNGDDIQDFAILTVPMGQTERPMNAECSRPVERNYTMRMFPDPPSDPRGALYSKYNHQDVYFFGAFYISEPAWSLIDRTCWDFVRLETRIDFQKIRVDYPANFWDRLGRQPVGLKNIAVELRSWLDYWNPKEQVSIKFIFPNSRGWERDWYVFLSNKRKINSGVLDLQALCNLRVENLDYTKMLIGHHWRDDELAWKRLMAWNCGKTFFQARLLPFPGTEWIPTTSDLAEYGINGTRLPTAYLMAISLRYVREFLPDIGTKSRVLIRELAQKGYALPRPPLADAEVKKLASRLQRNLSDAEDWATRKIWRPPREMTQRDIEDIQVLFKDRVAADVGLFLPMPSAGEPHNAAAEQAAVQLQKRDYENDEDHLERIVAWMREALCVAPKTRYHEPYTGIRLSLPPGVSADVALFFLEVPRQRDWPRRLKKPPMAIEEPWMPRVTDLQNFLDTAFAKHRDVLRAEIYYSVGKNWASKECETIPIMNEVDYNAEETAWWKSMVKSTKLAKE